MKTVKLTCAGKPAAKPFYTAMNLTDRHQQRSQRRELS